ncbi:hypothetical protein [Candidatus Deferrimicrobium sp.]|uniref:hypothetical protein n=1 Tax=Candidatus Deferrimicrobium sp. TaxID=3060586 RepID=UPI00272882C2|nr:hypothetical protein [Candidatus Deferrimicrobium sp.]MDO8739153.1 hypothetical protein [Candidatus Deferrimicrobium sp.]
MPKGVISSNRSMVNPSLSFGSAIGLHHLDAACTVPVGPKAPGRGACVLGERSFIEAMGGQLEIKAVFPDGAVCIRQIKELKKEPAVVKKTRLAS